MNDYAPAGLATCSTLVMTCTGAPRTITGFDHTGFDGGQIFRVVNDDSNNLTLAHGSGSSASGNRIGCAGAGNLLLRAGGAATIQYLPTDFAVAPFRVVAVNA